MSRPSTPYLVAENVDARDKPGHDGWGNTVPEPHARQSRRSSVTPSAARHVADANSTQHAEWKREPARWTLGAEEKSKRSERMLPTLAGQSRMYVQQVFEMAELFGFETRNKYRIRDENSRDLLFAAE